MRVSQLVAINFISQQTSEKGISISVVPGQDNVFLNPHLLFLSVIAWHLQAEAVQLPPL